MALMVHGISIPRGADGMLDAVAAEALWLKAQEKRFNEKWAEFKTDLAEKMKGGTTFGDVIAAELVAFWENPVYRSAASASIQRELIASTVATTLIRNGHFKLNQLGDAKEAVKSFIADNCGRIEEKHECWFSVSGGKKGRGAGMISENKRPDFSAPQADPEVSDDDAELERMLAEEAAQLAAAEAPIEAQPAAEAAPELVEADLA